MQARLAPSMMLMFPNYLDADVDALLSSIDDFFPDDGMPSKAMRRSFPQPGLIRAQKFVANASALSRAFDLELISCQRLVDILVPPFIKLAKLRSRVSSSGHLHHPGMSADSDWAKHLDAFFKAWTMLVF